MSNPFHQPALSIQGISKQFGSTNALTNISLDIRQGEIFALLGPSGCGKSTLLRLIAGLETPSAGVIELGGRDITSLPPNKRPINMVFQSYALFPHMSVQQNVAYGLKMDKVAKDEVTSRVAEALARVRLSDYARRKPDQLSGGQRQRVALARALVKRPQLLLLDEPLSALDANLRDAMRLELIKLQETLDITFIIVTHDQAEALALSDRIAVMEAGEIRQVASPTVLYQQPVDAFVANFIGTSNTFNISRVVNDESIDESRQSLHVEALGTLLWPDANERISLPAVVSVRPECVSISREKPITDNICVQGILGDIAFQGQYSIAEVRLPEGRSLTAIIDNELGASLPPATSNTPIWAHWHTRHMHLLPGRTTLSP